MRRLDLSHPLDANLDCGEDSDDNTGKEDDDLEGRDAPETVERLRGDNEISDRVDDNGRQGCIRDVEEDGREEIDGEKDDDAGNDASKWRAHAGLCFDGGSRERSSRGVATEEGTESEIGRASVSSILSDACATGHAYIFVMPMAMSSWLGLIV